MKPRRIFVDTEWTAPPWSPRAQLMWVGLADEAGRAWYGISSEVEIDPSTNDFMSGVFRYITPQEPRLSRSRLAADVRRFCGEVDEFWAWVPTPERFAETSGLGAQAREVYERCRDVDLQMLQALVQPWPTTWPQRLHDLNAAAVATGVEIPPRAPDHLHPRVHALWNRQLFERLLAAGAYARASS